VNRRDAGWWRCAGRGRPDARPGIAPLSGGGRWRCGCNGGCGPDSAGRHRRSRFVSPDTGAAGRGDLHEISEQDSTDFDKALRHLVFRWCLRWASPARGSTMNLPYFTRWWRGPNTAASCWASVTSSFMRRPGSIMDLAADTRVSLFPMAAVTGGPAGCAGPSTGSRSIPPKRIGTSNEATGGSGPRSRRTDRVFWSSCRAVSWTKRSPRCRPTVENLWIV
jgi:hypothetical protein